MKKRASNEVTGFRADATDRLSEAGLLDTTGRKKLAVVLIPGFAMLISSVLVSSRRSPRTLTS